MDAGALRSWMDGYIQAWTNNDDDQIGRLFSSEARYYTAPFREPWTGRDAIVAGWLDRKDDPGTWTFRYELLGTTDDLGIVRGWTSYSDGTNYSNLWLIRLDEDGRCTEFTEWWMEER
jgi:SnoaL-like domain